MALAQLTKVFIYLLIVWSVTFTVPAISQEKEVHQIRETTLIWMYFDAQRVKSADELRLNMRWAFYRSDFDGGGISQRDHELTALKRASTSYAQRASETFTFDLDRDGKVTIAELRLGLLPDARLAARGKARPAFPTEEQIESSLEKYVEQFLKRDFDGDGIVTVDEAFQEARQYYSSRDNRGEWLWPLPTLAFDLDGNTVISAAEFEVAVDAIIEEFDNDGDGQFSEQERRLLFAAASKMRRELRRREMAQFQ